MRGKKVGCGDFSDSHVEQDEEAAKRHEQDAHNGGQDETLLVAVGAFAAYVGLHLRAAAAVRAGGVALLLRLGAHSGLRGRLMPRGASEDYALGYHLVDVVAAETVLARLMPWFCTHRLRI